jgi:uncharacterized protein
MNRNVIALSAAAVAICCLIACKKEKGTTAPSNAYDKAGMLTYYADNIIIPGYTTMLAKVNTLEAAVYAFADTPSTQKLAIAQAAYREAHLQYNRIAIYQFGPAETALLDPFVNFSGGLDYDFNTSGSLTGFSIDTATIEANIAAGNANLAVATRANFYAQGFPALSYLLFSNGAIARFASSSTQYRGKYYKDVVTRMKNLFSTVGNGWQAYRSTFVANTQTNVGSPIGNMVNQLAYQTDLLKGPRLGWPFGKQSGGMLFADKVESYYSGMSVTLALESLAAIKGMYTANGSGKGLSDYLVSLNATALNNDVLAQFDIVAEKLRAIPDPLSTSLVANSTQVDAAYREIQKLVTLMKTDVASATAVQITFTDNDGD